MNLYRLLLAHLFAALLLSAETPRFKVVTYNLENYLVERSGTRAPKPEAARRKVTETLTALRPDVLACLLYTSPSPRDVEESRMPSSA